jgi:hypothetical protein
MPKIKLYWSVDGDFSVDRVHDTVQEDENTVILDIPNSLWLSYSRTRNRLEE